MSANPTKLAPLGTRAAPPTRGFSAVPFLGDLVVLARLVRDREATVSLKMLALGTLLYVISPIDALPEMMVPFIGWIDDVGLVMALRMLIEPKLAKYRYPLFELPPAPIVVAPAGEDPASSSKRSDQFARG